MTSATTLDEPGEPGRGSRWTITIFALVGLGLGLLYFAFRTPTYEAEILVRITNPVGPMADQVNVANSREILDAASNALGYPPQVSITAAEAAQILTIVGSAADPQEAAASANAVADTYVQAQLGPPATAVGRAEVPNSPVGLGPIAFAAIGTALGAAFGALTTFLQSMTGSRRREEEPPAAPPRQRSSTPRDPGVGEVAAAAKEVGWNASGSQGFDDLSDLAPHNLIDTAVVDDRPLRDAEPVLIAAAQAPPEEPAAPKSQSLEADPDAAAGSSFAHLSGMAELDSFEKEVSATSSRWSPEIEVPSQVERPTELIDLSQQAEPKHQEPEPAEFIDLASLDAKRVSADVSTAPAPTPQAPVGPAPAQVRQPDPPLTPPPATPEPLAPQPVAASPTPATPEPLAPEPVAAPSTPAAQPVATQQPVPQPPPPTAMQTTHPERPPQPAPPADLAVAAQQQAPQPVFAAAVLGQDVPGTPESEALSALERQALQSQFETALYEQSLAHEQQLAHVSTEHEHEIASLTTQVASLNKKLRVQTARLKNRAGTDQNRVGDLEAQLAAVEADLVEVKETLENERILHTKRVTEQRGVADRALDNARRQYREELAKHVHTHRTSLADHRSDLDRELANDRAQQSAALEAEHLQYEAQLEAERARTEERAAAAEQRHDKALAKLREETQHKLDTQMEQHRNSIASLRTTNEDAEQQVLQLERDNRALRAELSTQRKQTHETQIELQTQGQRLSDELVLMRSELDGERERNAALRTDVLRRSAEAHQAIDRAVEERTAQLAELEATVERQREYADRRVSEMAIAAEEQARESAVREANLTAEISRLKRDIESPGATPL